MRRLAKLAIAMTMVLSVGMTAMASGSISTTYTVEGAVADDGTVVEVVVSASEESLTVTEAIETLETLTSSITFDIDDAVVILQDISFVGDYSLLEPPFTFTLSVGGVTSGMKVAVLHYLEDAGEWEYVDATAGDGTVTFSLDSLSPVAVIIEGSSTTSPETGEVGTMAVAMLGMVALGAAVVVSKRKVA